MKFISIVISIFLFLCVSLSNPTVESSFYIEYNSYRSSNKLNELVVDTILEKAAKRHSLYLALLNRQYTDTFIITHYEDIPVVDVNNLYSVGDRVHSFDTTIRYHIGENITAVYNGDMSAQQIMYNWEHSIIHNKILLDSKNKRMGIGVVKYLKIDKPCVYVTLVVSD